MSTSLKELIQKIAMMGIPTIAVGVVTQLNPLRITLSNDVKINLSAMSLIIPKRHEEMEIGDRFYLLSINNHKVYYLLDRV